MLRTDGYVKLLDFGLARLLGDASPATNTETFTTAPNTIPGTPAYMSSEQARGEMSTPASDIFSLGLVLYEMAVGRHPYPTASKLGVLQAIVSEAPVPPSRIKPEIPRLLEDFVLRMLIKSAERRPSPSEVAGG